MNVFEHGSSAQVLLENLQAPEIDELLSVLAVEGALHTPFLDGTRPAPSTHRIELMLSRQMKQNLCKYVNLHC
jgi:hypothetical protein